MTANDTDTEDWEPTEETDESSGEDDESRADASTADDGTAIDVQRPLTEYVQWALLGLLVLVTVIATLRFYFAASTAVDRFVSRQYRPLFQAAFNLVVLLAAGVGLSVLVRRLS